ncbi:hypothetical protein FACS189490_00280 [Clostridia bacterium]|nr:hypothetical protein FACS189490_00280 [Clostridia bacterium]
MGFHMLVTDADRNAYLQNVNQALKNGAPFMLYRESVWEGSPDAEIKDLDEWIKLTGEDYTTPALCQVEGKEVYVPLVPARARSHAQYIDELQSASFIVDRIIDLESSREIAQPNIHILAIKR